MTRVAPPERRRRSRSFSLARLRVISSKIIFFPIPYWRARLSSSAISFRSAASALAHACAVRTRRSVRSFQSPSSRIRLISSSTIRRCRIRSVMCFVRIVFAPASLSVALYMVLYWLIAIAKIWLVIKTYSGLVGVCYVATPWDFVSYC